MKRAIGLGLALCALALLASVMSWDRAPEPFPIHWGLGGRPDGFGSKAFGLLMLPGLMVVLTALLPLTPLLEPRREHARRSTDALAQVMVGLLGFFCGLHLLLLRAALSEGMILHEAGVMLLLGLLWIVLGNALGKVKSNHYLGIRTPWTLANEAVWHRTHRLAGWSFAVGGVLVIGAGALLSGVARFAVGLGLLLASSLWPVAYSWFAYRAETGRSL